MYSKKWTNDQLISAVKLSSSYRQVIKFLGLVPAGGNYQHVQRIVQELNINTSHFKGKGWSSGLKIHNRKKIPLELLLVAKSHYQTHKLKQRLIQAGIKSAACELCGWSDRSEDGRIPIELDHINGNHMDCRLENLRILCPNCHSLQTTHRGVNKVKYRRGISRGGETGQTRET